MAIKNRTQLKSNFVSGTAATASKFDDIFDSHFNRYDDSVLAGPIGQTGTNGLVGPSGSTFYNGLVGPTGDTFYKGLLGPIGSTHYTGLWFDPNTPAPIAATAAGSTGQVVISGTSLYICQSLNSWIKITTTSF